MAQPAEESAGAKSDAKNKRGPRPFPVDSFADSLALARGIHTHGAGNSMRRLTLFDKLGSKPESGPSRQLVTNSNKYGLTTGNSTSEHIVITEDAAKYLDDSTPPSERLRMGFDLAIGRNEIFAKLYERLKDKRVPAPDVLRDELHQVGVAADQRDQAARVFLDNVRHLNLVRELSGVERLIAVEQAIEEQARRDPAAASVSPLAPTAVPATPVAPAAMSTPDRAPASPDPSVHIDIQIHIDASASPEQIDQIFASMAKHLYRRGGTE